MSNYIRPNASIPDPSGLFHCFARGHGKGATVGINVVEADGPKAGRFGSWLCKNVLAEALMAGDPGAVAVCSDFLEFAIFPFLERS
jgi:hypothetical protein